MLPSYLYASSSCTHLVLIIHRCSSILLAVLVLVAQALVLLYSPLANDIMDRVREKLNERYSMSLNITAFKPVASEQDMVNLLVRDDTENRSCLGVAGEFHKQLCNSHKFI